MRIGHATGHRYGEQTKAPEVQVVTAESDDGAQTDAHFAMPFGPWCLFAVPPTREVDAAGNVKGACEVAVEDLGDESLVVGFRDVRVAKYAQDLKPGEFALVNEIGHRIFVGKDVVSLTAGGGFLNFDVTQKKVAIVGIPPTPGGAAPYISMDTTGIGLVSATGAASVLVKTSNVTLSGAAVAIDAGRVDLGKGAADPVVTYSQLMTMAAQLMAWAAGLPAPSAVGPLLIVVKPGTRVFAPPM